MGIAYVAGPFRGPNHWEIHQNILRSEALALEVWLAGHAALSPHKNTECYQGVTDDQVWLDGDLEMLRRCDAILLIPGWGSSEGTKIEVAEAERMDIPVFESLDACVAYLDKIGEINPTERLRAERRELVEALDRLLFPREGESFEDARRDAHVTLGKHKAP